MLGEEEQFKQFFRLPRRIVFGAFFNVIAVVVAVFLFFIGVIVIPEPALAADDNAVTPLCQFIGCDTSQSVCQSSSGKPAYPWTSNGYPGGAGNKSCCGDDSQEVIDSCRAGAGATCTGSNACIATQQDGYCIYNGNIYAEGTYLDTADSSSDTEVCAYRNYSFYNGSSGAMWFDQDWHSSICQSGVYDDASIFCKNAGPNGNCGASEIGSTMVCCGDDSNEKVVTQRCGGGSVSVCCPSSASWYNPSSGSCVSTCPDTTSPSVSVNGAPSGWQNWDASASVGCSDSGSGCNSSTYRLLTTDGSQSCSTGYSNYNLTSPQTVSSETWYCAAAKDNAGNAGFTSSSVQFRVDTIPPVGSIGGAPSGWSNSATMTLSCSDSGGSGCNSSRDGYILYSSNPFVCPVTFSSYTAYSGGVTISSNQWVCAQVNDNAGTGHVLAPVEFRVDTTNPSASFSGNGSTCERITWTIASASDSGGSGLVSSPYSFDNGSNWQSSNTLTDTVTGGGSRSRTARVRDNAGNQWSSSATVSTDPCDSTAPSVSASPSSSSGWRNYQTGVSLSASDSGSGVASAKYRIDNTDARNGTSYSNGNSINLPTGQGCQTLYLWARDNAGNETNNPGWTSGSYCMDTTNPSASFSGNGSTCERITWTISNASDSGGSSLASSPYSFDDGYNWQSSNTLTDTVTGGGSRSRTARVRDNAGNQWSSSSTTVSTSPCDSTAPSVSASPSSSSGWRNYQTNVSLSASDSGSGVASAKYRIDNTDARNGTSYSNGNSINLPTGQGCQTLYLWARDNAGNETNNPGWTSGSYCMDTTNPTCGSPTYSPSGWTSGSVTVTVSCSDTGGSGCQQSTYSTAVSSNGTPSFTIQDNAGNSVTSSCGANVTNIDSGAPSINSLTVNSVSYPSSVTVTSGDPTIAWTASDSGSGLQQAEVWRANGSCSSPSNWQPAYTTTSSVASGSWTNTSLANGTYCFGLHVKDNVGNCRNEDGSSCSGGSGGGAVRGPITVTINRPTPDFQLLASPASRPVVRGSSGTYTVDLSGSGGFNSSVSFSASGLGSGATASFSPASCTPTCSSTLTISTTGSAQTGTFTITISGTGGGLTRTDTVSLTVDAGDTLSPSVSVSGAPSGWQYTSATASVSCSDASGCNASSYRLKQESSAVSCSTTYSQYTLASPQTVTSERYYCAAAQDNAPTPNTGFSSTAVRFMVDRIAPSISSFTVDGAAYGTTANNTDGTPMIAWNTSDTGGSGINRVEIWRAPDVSGSPGTWGIANTTSSASGSWSDSVGNGTYWYGIHVIDNTSNGGNCIQGDTSSNNGHCGGATSDSLDVRTRRDAIRVVVNVSCATPTYSVTDPVNTSWNTSDTVTVSWSGATNPTGDWGYSSDATCNASDSYPTSGNSASVTTSHNDYVCFRNSNACGTTYTNAQGPLQVDATNPTASFTVTPSTGTVNTTSFAVDASGSSDNFTSAANLRVRWDWENDGTYDTTYTTNKSASHIYSTAGTMTIRLQVQDSAGNTGTYTQTVTVNNPVDSTPPTVSVGGAPASWQYTSATASVSCSDASGCNTSSYRLKQESSAVSCSTTYSQYTLASPQTVNVDTYYCAAAQDNAGTPNTGFSSTAVRFMVDRIAPSISSFTVDGAAYGTTANNTDGTPMIAWNTSDTGGSGINRVEIWRAPDVSGSPGTWGIANTTSSASGSWSDSVGNGTYWYGIHVIDNTSNGGNCVKGDTTHCGGVVSDSLDPRSLRDPIRVVVNAACPLPSYNVTDPVNASWNTSDTVAVSWTGATNPTGSRKWPNSTATCDGSGTYQSGNSMTVLTSYTDYICFRNSNACGTTYTGALGPLRVDTTNPTASFPSPSPTSGTVNVTSFAVDASASSDNYTSSSNLEVRWDWEADGTYDTTYSTTKTNSHIYPTTGTKTIRVQVRDQAGNTATATQTVTVNSGGGGSVPDTQITSQPTNPTASPTASFTFTGSEGPTGFDCRLDSGSWSGCSTGSVSYTVTQGTHTFEVRAYNTNGSDDSPASYSWLADLTPPTVDAFSINGQTNATDPVTATSPLTVGWTVSDTGGSYLQQAEIWRAPQDAQCQNGTEGTCSWTQVSPVYDAPPNTNSWTSTVSNNPPANGNWWYGSHAVDNVDRWADEGNLGPILVQYSASGPNPPSCNPGSGTYPDPQTVPCSSDPGTSIRYTTDGTDPTTSSPLYTGPITISNDTTLKARAYDTGNNGSTVTTNDYIISSGTNQNPTAQYQYCKVSGTTIQFVDTSTDLDGAVTGWSWDFGDSQGITAINDQFNDSTVDPAIWTTGYGGSPIGGAGVSESGGSLRLTVGSTAGQSAQEYIQSNAATNLPITGTMNVSVPSTSGGTYRGFWMQFSPDLPSAGADPWSNDNWIGFNYDKPAGGRSVTIRVSGNPVVRLWEDTNPVDGTYELSFTQTSYTLKLNGTQIASGTISPALPFTSAYTYLVHTTDQTSLAAASVDSLVVVSGISASTSTEQHPVHTFTGGTSWWNDNWQFRRQITMNNTSGSSHTNFPMLVKLDQGTRIDYGQTNNSGADAGYDIRFVDSDTSGCPAAQVVNGMCVLNYEIEKWDGAANGTSNIWVKIPALNAGSDSVWMYYGNPAASGPWVAAGTTKTAWTQGVWDSNFKLVQHLKETSGPHNDSTSNGNNSTAVTVTTQGSAIGKINGTDDFDGTDDLVTITDSASFDIGTGNATWEAWVAIDSNSTFDGIMSQTNGTTATDGWWLTIFPSGVVNFAMNDSDHQSNPLTWTSGTLYYVTVVKSGTSISFYRNGVFLNSVNNNVNINNSAGTFRIGREGSSYDTGNAFTDGRIDEVRLSSVARSANWVDMTYDQAQDTVNTFGGEESQAAAGQYTVTLTAYDDKGATDQESKVVDIALVPTCGFFLTNVSSLACNSTTASWNTSIAGNTYDVYRRVGAGTYNIISTINGSDANCNAFGCSYTDLTTQGSTQYSYYVQARAGTNVYNNSTSNPSCSGASSTCPLSVTTPACGGTGLTAASNTCGVIAISWNSVQDAVTYNLYRAIADSPGSYQLVKNLSSLSYTDKEIIPGQTYYYYVKPKYADNSEGGASQTQSAKSFCYRGPVWEER